MADNLSVAITADATPLKVAMAVAKQSLADYKAAVADLATQMRDTGAASQVLQQRVEDARIAYNGAASAVRQASAGLVETRAASIAASAGLEQTAASAVNATHASTGMTREVLVLGSEMLRGNFSRIPGSMMVLAERSGGVLTAITAMSGGMMAAVGAAGALAGAFAFLIMRAHETEAALRGVYNAALAQGRDAAAAEGAARAAADAMAASTNIGARAALTLSTTIAQLPNATDNFRAALQRLAPSMMQVLHPGNAEEMAKQLDQVFRSSGSMRQFAAEFDLLHTNEQRALEDAEKANNTDAARDIVLQGLQRRYGGVAEAQKAASDATNRDVMLQMAGVSKLAPSIMQAYDAAGGAVVHFQTRLQQTAAMLASSDMKPAAPMADWATQISQAATQAGEKAVAAAYAAGDRRQAIVEAELKAEIAVYDKAATDMTRTDTERNSMAAAAAKLRMSLMKDESTANTAAAKKSAQDVIAGYDEQIAAARGNLAQIETLETQKLAFLQGVYGRSSSEYQKALSEQMAALRAAITEETGEIKTAGTQQIEERKAELDLEVAQHKMTKADELRAEIAFDDQVHAAQLLQLDGMISTLQKGTAAYGIAMRDRHNLDVQFQLQHQEMLAKMMADDDAQAQRDMALWLKAANAIEQDFASSIAGIITRRESWMQVEQRFANTVIQETATILMHFLGAEIAKTAAHLLGVEARVAADQAEGATGMETIIISALKAIGAYAAETFGGIFANLSPVMGPAAAGPAAAGYAAVLAMEGAASAASGTSYVPQDMLANIHQGEIIMPRYDADLIRGGGVGGGHTFIYNPEFNGVGNDVQRQTRQAHEDFKGYIHQISRNGQLALPGRAQRAT